MNTDDLVKLVRKYPNGISYEDILKQARFDYPETPIAKVHALVANATRNNRIKKASGLHYAVDVADNMHRIPGYKASFEWVESHSHCRIAIIRVGDPPDRDLDWQMHARPIRICVSTTELVSAKAYKDATFVVIQDLGRDNFPIGEPTRTPIADGAFVTIEYLS